VGGYEKAGCCVVAFVGYVKCACVPQLFQQLINTMLVQLFSGNSSIVSLLCTYLNRLFIKILSSSLNTMLFVDKHCNDICYDEFLMPQIDHNSK